METASEDFLMFNDVVALLAVGRKNEILFCTRSSERQARREENRFRTFFITLAKKYVESERRREIYIFFIHVKSAWGWLIGDSEKMSLILNPWVILWINNFQSVVCIASSNEHLLRTLNLNLVCVALLARRKKNSKWQKFRVACIWNWSWLWLRLTSANTWWWW